MNYTQAMDRMQHLGLKPEIYKPILNQIQIWLQSSGPEWTVSRLKDLKLWYVHSLSGKPFSSGWISSRDGIPTGPFRPIFKLGCTKALNTLLVYTSFVSSEVTNKQRKKFWDSVLAEDVLLPHIPELKTVAEEFSSLVPKFRPYTYKEYPWSSSRMTMSSNGKSIPESIDSLLMDLGSPIVLDFIDKYEDIYLDVIDDLYLPAMKIKEEERNPVSESVGKISVIQEPGFKARFIANPRRVFQIFLRGLGKQCFGLLKRLPWDCTYNQNSGVQWVQQKLASGVEVQCVDLSDATNNFPLNLQLRIAHWLGFDTPSLLLFEELSRANWYVPKHLRRDANCLIQWSKGQPLGLYPSFPLFAISHGFLVEALARSLEVEDSFRILGDDIVISNQALYQLYMKYLDLLQIPVSHQKCIISDKVAEFAGNIILPSKSFAGNKWRTPSAKNRLALLSSLPRALDLSSRDEFLSYIQRSAPIPFGKGENPEGIPMKIKSMLFYPWYRDILLDNGINLVRPSVGSFTYTSEILSQSINETPLNRKELERLLPDWLSGEDPYERVRSEPVHFVLSKLIHQFDFRTIRVPSWFWKSEYFSSTHRNYLLCGVVEEYHKKPTFMKLLYKKWNKGMYDWIKLGPHKRELILSDIRSMFLHSLEASD